MPSTSPLSEPASAIVFDGQSARPWQARLQRVGQAFVIEVDGTGHETVPLDLLRQGSDGAGSRTVLHRRDRPDWRAISDEPLPRGWLTDVAPLHRPSRGKLIGGAVATLSVLLVVAGLWFRGGHLLTWAAPLVPHRIAASVGRAVVQQMSLGTRRCKSAEGQAALDRLVGRLRPTGGFVEPLDVTVIENPAVNAFAAPGGQIAIFSGLIDQARSSDEVAGVLAHEIGHVQLRHPTKALIRHTGLSLAAQSLGGNVGGMADLAVLLQSTRGSEADADAEAIRLLAAARISPGGLERFFARLQADEDRHPKRDQAGFLDRLADYTATHPSDSSRQAAMAEAARRSTGASPATSAADWQALRTICGS